MTSTPRPDWPLRWPAVRGFAPPALRRVRMPIGGIGTGCVALGGRGELVDWEIFNDPGKGRRPRRAVNLIRIVEPATGRRWTRVLEGAIDPDDLDGAHGSPLPYAGLPRFAEVRFDAAYPLGTVTLSDPRIPARVRIEGFNPLIPGDSAASSYPVVDLRISVRADPGHTLEAQICVISDPVLAPEHCTRETWEPAYAFDVDTHDATGTTVVAARSADVSGGFAIAALDAPADAVVTGWPALAWDDAITVGWHRFDETGRLPDAGSDTATATDTDTATGTGPTVEPVLGLVRDLRVGSDTVASARFAIGWFLPDRLGWAPGAPERPAIGNHHTTRHPDVVEMLRDYGRRRDELERRTVDFVASVSGAGMPAAWADAALSTLAVLKSPTCFVDAQGRFFAWEGTNDTSGSCHGSCTHVWNYQYALEALFPDLAWTMHETAFGSATTEAGRMAFRVDLPLPDHATDWPLAAADGQYGAVVRLWRTLRATGEADRLWRLWPRVRAAIAFAWIPGGWDADGDGLMEGCQHTTMDVEWYGPSGVNQSWYLAGLAAGEQLALAVDDHDFAERCRTVRASGARLTDAELWDDGWYPHRVGGLDLPVADGLRAAPPDPDTPGHPVHQVGDGCAADQLVGDAMAQLSGLETGLDPDHRRRAWASVLTHNRRDSFSTEVNPRRAYVVGEESGLLVCSYPRGGMPLRPSPYHREVWTGLEYTTAIGLALTGRLDDATAVVTAVRERHDGRRRNPFDEVECGHHYARSMAAWGLVEAWHATRTT